MQAFDPPTSVMSAETSSGLKETISFQGKGREYFGIWAVNTMLIMLTLTLYWPFARARRMAYFQGNTFVGEDPLGFHGDPWKMFRGYLLMVGFGVVNWVVSTFFHEWAWIMIFAFSLFWPALWRASLQFRLRNTSWRGVRFNFEGSLKQAYVVMLPFFVPAMVLSLVSPQVDSEGHLAPGALSRFGVGVGATVLLSLIVLPYCFSRLKTYQHGNYRFAQETTRLKVGAGAFYKLISQSTLILGLILCVSFGGWYLSIRGFKLSSIYLSSAFFFFVSYFVLPAVVGGFYSARLQNVLWRNTESAHIRFQSQLRAFSLIKLNLVNIFLVMITLGFYWPYARIAAAKLRLEALSVEIDSEVFDELSDDISGPKGVVGDAAGDFFGIDLGL